VGAHPYGATLVVFPLSTIISGRCAALALGKVLIPCLVGRSLIGLLFQAALQRCGPCRGAASATISCFTHCVRVRVRL